MFSVIRISSDGHTEYMHGFLTEEAAWDQAHRTGSVDVELGLDTTYEVLPTLYLL